MVNYFIYAKDCSLSTINNKHYHTNSLKALEQFKQDVDNFKEDQLAAGESPTESKNVYLHWGDDCYEVDEDSTTTANLELIFESGNREPDSIIRILKEKYIDDANDKIKLLYIITDGMISNESVKKCIELNQDMHYETVVFHALNENLEKIDLSVAASFFKSQCIVYRNYELIDSTNISSEFDYDKINCDNFANEKHRLKSYIKLKFINFRGRSFTSQENEKLREHRDRLFTEVLSQCPVYPLFDSNLEERKKSRIMLTFDRDDYLRRYLAHYEKKCDLEESIATFMRYLYSEVSYSFDTLKFDTKEDKSVEEEQISDDDSTDEMRDDEDDDEFPRVVLLESYP